MSLFKGKMCQHIPGFKELSEHETVIEIMDTPKVYIPLIVGPSTNVSVLVETGAQVKVGTMVALCDERNYVPLFSSVSGTVVGIEKRMHSSLKQINHLVIENDGLYQVDETLEGIDYKTASNEELIDFMMKKGIVGLGGAGFPAYIKYKFAKDVQMLIINAVECEPFITADYKSIFTNMKNLIDGVLAMKKMANAKEAVIAIKKSHPDLITFVKGNVELIEGVKVVEVPDVYPMGWERVLVRQILKKEYDRLPGEVGAVVNNVETAIAFGEALNSGLPIVNKTLTISGTAIAKPSNVTVPIGTPADYIVAKLGGYTEENVKIIAGGPMMGKTVVNDKFVVDRPTNAITILANIPYDSVACLRCGKCSDHCPAGLQPVRIAQAVKTKDKAAMQRLCATDCIECGLCTYICPSRLDVTENVRRAKRQLMMAKK